MKLFLDENIQLSALHVIRELGFDVEHASQKFRGSPDKEIAEYARKQKAILITKDLEFGNLLRYPKDSHYGLLIIRLPNFYTAKQTTTELKNFLEKIPLTELINAIFVLEIGRYRSRKF